MYILCQNVLFVIKNPTHYSLNIWDHIQIGRNQVSNMSCFSKNLSDYNTYMDRLFFRGMVWIWVIVYVSRLFNRDHSKFRIFTNICVNSSSTSIYFPPGEKFVYLRRLCWELCMLLFALLNSTELNTDK